MTLIVDPAGLDTETHLVLHFFMKYSDRSGCCYYDLYDAARELAFYRDNVVYYIDTLTDMDRLVQKQGKKGLAYVVLIPCQCSREVVHNDALAWKLLVETDPSMQDHAGDPAYSKKPKPLPPKGSGPGGKSPMHERGSYARTYAPDPDMHNVIRGVFPTESDDFNGPVARHVDWCGPVQDSEKKFLQPSWANTLVSGSTDIGPERKSSFHLTTSGMRLETTFPQDDERKTLGFDSSPHHEVQSTEARDEVPAKQDSHTLEGESLPSVLKGGRIVKRRGLPVNPDTAVGLAIHFRSLAEKYDQLSRTNYKALAAEFAKDLKVMDAEPIRRSIELFFKKRPRATVTPLWKQYLTRRRALLEACNKPYLTEKHRFDKGYKDFQFGAGDYRRRYADGTAKLK